MEKAVNAGLMGFKGFNQPMFLPSSYDWYPPFTDVSDVATMKLPDGKFMKLFLGMQLQMAGVDMETIQQLIGRYPAFSNGVTLGGHGVVPNPQQNALGSGGRAGGCQQCHVAGGALETQVPVTKESYVNVTGFGTLALPVYKWKYYNIHQLIHLGLSTRNEDVVSGAADIDIDGDPEYVRGSAQEMVLNWFGPTTCGDSQESQSEPVGCFLRADSSAALAGTDLTRADLTWEADAACDADDCPEWMPVLEPVTAPAPNYAVLGYAKDEVIWDPDDPRINPGPPGGGEVPVIDEATWSSRNAKFGKLAVGGTAGAQDHVEIINGLTKDPLFSLRAGKDGTFEGERNTAVSIAPCTVAAKVDARVGQAVPVQNAPDNCIP
jgi:hypothetical protein